MLPLNLYKARNIKVPSPINASVRLLLIASVAVFAQWSVAEELPDLPEAFDAGWKGEKTCELLYETDSVRVGLSLIHI